MARANHHDGRRNRGRKRSISTPFNINVPSSLRDPEDPHFSDEQLSSLRNDDNAREFALKYLHNHEKFATVWNLTTIHPNTRRLMRKVAQIQTINAVCNGYKRKKIHIFSSINSIVVIYLDSIDCLMVLK
jgi:hypothetical protein